MTTLDTLRDALPEPARDLKLNLQGLLDGGALSPTRRLGVAIAVAAAARSPRLVEALAARARAEFGEGAGAAVADDALAAAALMAMTNVLYRFRSLVEDPAYADKPARLRMNRLARPATSKLDLELFVLAVSAVNGCGTCVKAHEKVVAEGGVSKDEVHDTIRLAATVYAAAVALEFPAVGAAPAAAAAA